MDPALDPPLVRLGILNNVRSVLCVCVRAHLLPDVHGRTEAAQVPPCGFKTWKLPAVIPEMIRSCPLEEFTVCYDRAKPRLTRK